MGHVNVQSCLLIVFEYQPISFYQYSWLSVERAFRFWSSVVQELLGVSNTEEGNSNVAYPNTLLTCSKEAIDSRLRVPGSWLALRRLAVTETGYTTKLVIFIQVEVSGLTRATVLSFYIFLKQQGCLLKLLSIFSCIGKIVKNIFPMLW